MANAEDRLLINLLIVGKLQPFQKLNAKAEMLGIENLNWFSSFTRWMRTDDRHVCVRRLVELTEEIEKILDSKDIYLKDRVEKKIPGFLEGLGHLRTTYEDDVATSSHLQLLGERVKNCLEKNQILNPQCFENSDFFLQNVPTEKRDERSRQYSENVGCTGSVS